MSLKKEDTHMSQVSICLNSKASIENKYKIVQSFGRRARFELK